MSTWINAVSGWFSSELWTHFGFLLALIFLANLLRQRRSPSSTIAWLLGILLLPYVGVPLYVIFGGRKMNPMARRKARIYRPRSAAEEAPGDAGTERLLASYGVPPARPGNRVVPVTDGVGALRWVLRLIDEARETIHVTTYILGSDAAGREIIDRLASRAAAGVSVRLLLDDLGSWRLRRRHLAPLVAAGASVAHFMPVLHVPFRGRANLRNHRKLLLVDGRIALTGGMNLAWPYMGPPSSTGLWRDIAVVLEGPAVSDLETIFASDWAFATGAPLVQKPSEAPPAAGDETAGAAELVSEKWEGVAPAERSIGGPAISRGPGPLGNSIPGTDVELVSSQNVDRAAAPERVSVSHAGAAATWGPTSPNRAAMEATATAASAPAGPAERDATLASAGPSAAVPAPPSEPSSTSEPALPVLNPPAGEAALVQVVATGPDVAGDPLYESLLALIFAARRRIWVVTPYFVPDEMLARALNLAARRGLDVRLIAPMRSNHPSADLARASFLRDLHKEGGKIMLYVPTMLHAKVVLIDDQVSIIGSANMDMRSLFLNYEVALFVWSRSHAQGIEGWAEELMARSTRELPASGRLVEIAENVVRLLSPLL